MILIAISARRRPNLLVVIVNYGAKVGPAAKVERAEPSRGNFFPPAEDTFAFARKKLELSS